MKKHIKHKNVMYEFKEQSKSYAIYREENGKKAVLLHVESDKITHEWDEARRIFVDIKTKKSLEL